MAEKGVITHDDLRLIYNLIPQHLSKLREAIEFMYYRCGTISCGTPEDGNSDFLLLENE